MVALLFTPVVLAVFYTSMACIKIELVCTSTVLVALVDWSAATWLFFKFHFTVCTGIIPGTLYVVEDRSPDLMSDTALYIVWHTF